MIIYDLPPWLIAVFLFAFGAVLGSFLNVCVHRLPKHTGLWESFKGLNHPPSRCPKCGTRILTRDNLPVVGWLALGGRCRACGTRISARYPVIEFLNGLLAVALYFLEVPAGRFAPLSEMPLATPFGPVSAEFPLPDFWHVHTRFLFHLLLLEVLLVASLIDFDLMVIPKSVTDPFIPVGVLGMCLGGLYLLPVHTNHPPVVMSESALWMFDGALRPDWIGSHPHWHGLACGLAGVAAGGLPVLLVRWIGTAVLRQEAMGMGDVYLMAMAGGFLGWQPILVALVLSLFISLATILAASVAGRFLPGLSQGFPFGPFLAAGCAATLFGWPWVWPRTVRLFAEMVNNWAFTAAAAVAMGISLAVLLGLLQAVKAAFGIRPPTAAEGDWTPADQNQYLACERPHEGVGQWERPNWPGGDAGRGQQFERQWRGRL